MTATSCPCTPAGWSSSSRPPSTPGGRSAPGPRSIGCAPVRGPAAPTGRSGWRPARTRCCPTAPPPGALYEEAIARLARADVAPYLARAQLVYGEWLRRDQHRREARDQLRSAHDAFVRLEAEAWAERARRELAATGETIRKRTFETRDALTSQESQIARLAADGHTNPEIAAQLFISPRTVEYHLGKIYPKLNIGSRRELRTALGCGAPA